MKIYNIQTIKFEDITKWTNEHPVVYDIFKYVIIVAVVLLILQFLKRLVRHKVHDTTARYKSQKGLEVIGYVLLIILSVSYFTGNIKDFTLAIGLFSAGLAFALQELILSVTGSLFIFIVKVYKPGDRIEINGIKGDVIDVDSMYTTMMEIGQWVTSDNYSGRIVKISNSFVFKGAVYNYSQDFPFIWDEFNIPITYNSDAELAKSIIVEIASKELLQFTSESKLKWQAVVERYYIEDAQLEPTLAVTLTDNWIQLNLRYIVDYKKRRHIKHLLNEAIRKEFAATRGKIIIASATFEIVKIPDVIVDKKNDLI